MDRRRLLFTLAALLPVSLLAAEPEWKTYTNPRFGFSISHPPELEAGPGSGSGDGNTFKSKDGKVTLLAYAHFLQKDDGDTLESRWKDELAKRGETVTYKKKGETWFVVSGVEKDGTEYYRKFATEKGNWATFLITYPHADHEKYDAWVTKIEKSFVPFLKGEDYDRVE